MAAPVHPVEEAFKSRDGLSPLNCRNWEAVGGQEQCFVLGREKGMSGLQDGLRLGESGTLAITSLRIMKVS